MLIIEQNPYRQLGVYSNSPTKERVANQGKMKAFLKVGKPVPFPLDLPDLLPAINRTEASVSDANSKLTLPNDQLRYGQFWWMKVSSIDDVAFNHLIKGDSAMAKSFWGKKNDFSSLQNRIVLALVQNDYASAIRYAEQLYSNQGFISSFVAQIVGDGVAYEATSLFHNFIDTLIDCGVDVATIQSAMTNDDGKAYVSSKAVKPLIGSINNAINEAKSISRDEPQARYSAAVKLANKSKPLMMRLRNLLDVSDLQYQTIADKLGLEILQCGIDYYNGSDDDDSPHKAMKIQKYAQSVVVGAMAKDRCKENVDILENIISQLPPKEVLSFHKAIQNLLTKYSSQSQNIKNAINLLKSSAPYIVAIKSALGVKHNYYLGVSTEIVNNALNSVIDEVNSVIEKQNQNIYIIISTFKEAWRATLYMDKFDLENDFEENRYNPNRKSLYGLIDQAKGFEDASLSFKYTCGCGFCNDIDVSDLDMRSDEELYAECNTIENCTLYIKNFPQGKHIEKVNETLTKLKFAQCKSIFDYEQFLNSCTIPFYTSKAKDILKKLKEKEKEREKIEEAQSKLINSCTSLDDIISLYEKERKSNINIDKCSIRAFDLSHDEKDYERIVTVFGIKSKGGELAKNKLDAINLNKKLKQAKNERIRNITLIVVAILTIIFFIYIIGGVRGIATTCIIIAVISGFVALFSFGATWRKILVVSAAVAAIFGITGHYLSLYSEKIEAEKEAAELYDQIILDPNIQQCKLFVNNYNDNVRIEEVRKILLNLLYQKAKTFDYTSISESTLDMYANQYNPIQELVKFADDNKYNEDGGCALSFISAICDSLYNVAKKTSTIRGWKLYQNIVPTNYFKDSENMIREIENLSWSTEAKAWKTATKENTISAYRKYQNLYPYGKHFNQSERKLVDLEVDEVYGGDHGTLPGMDRIGYESGPTTDIYVTNSTSYTLTLLYSGPDSKRLVIPANRSSSITLKNGRYRVAASVSAHNVGKYAGSENLSGGTYSVDYYISTHRY